MSDRPVPPGHKGGPSLDDPASDWRVRCRDCRHWTPPLEGLERDYEAFRLGLSRRRVNAQPAPATVCRSATARFPLFQGQQGISVAGTSSMHRPSRHPEVAASSPSGLAPASFGKGRRTRFLTASATAIQIFLSPTRPKGVSLLPFPAVSGCTAFRFSGAMALPS